MTGKRRVASRSEEQAHLLALIEEVGKTVEWFRVGSWVEELGSATRFIQMDWSGFETFDTDLAAQLAARVNEASVERAREVIEAAGAKQTHLTTILDENYPPNLREIYNRPPFLFIRGQLKSQDSRAVAVVGTRRASQAGVRSADDLATQLVDHGITVLSGLAKGIDAAAHTAALRNGGRTIAVLGTGLDQPIYPKGHEKLAEAILESGGALVSQFWPWTPPTRYTFPMRNVVMSGMAIGTAVIEANSTSGAKMQARLALEHGKRLFLLRRLVEQEEWASAYVKNRGALLVETVDEIVAAVSSVVEPPKQLSLA